MNGLKMLVIGFLLGVTIMLVLGANGSQKADFGFAVPANGRAIIKDVKGEIYFIDSNQNSAKRLGVGLPNLGGPLVCK